MAIDSAQVKDLLGQGLSNSVVASAVGCSESYISQLMSDPEFAAGVVAKRTELLAANGKRDQQIDGIEDTLIVRLKDLIDTHQIYKPVDVLRAFSLVNKAVRRGVPAHEHLTVQNTVVQLTIPVVLKQEIVMNSQSEVIEAGGQTLTTMSAQSLLNKLTTERPGKDGDKFKELGRFLPQGIEVGRVGATELQGEILLAANSATEERSR